MNRTLNSAMAAGAIVLALNAVPLHAAPLAPEEKPFRGKAEISDVTLEGMRGRYISADQILYFGVEMYTEWRNGAGELVGSSALNVGIDRSGPTPTVTASGDVNNDGAGTGGASPYLPPGGGLNKVQGVSQLVQVTGNGNGVTNSADVCVGAHCAAVAVTSGPANKDTGINSITGAQAKTYVNGSGIGVSVSVEGKGEARQSIASTTGIQQRALLSADSQTIHNQLNMVIQVQPNISGSATQIRDLSQTMRSLWQAGIR